VSTTDERLVALPVLPLYGDGADGLDEPRPLLLDTQPRVDGLRRRGWLVHRFLLAADVLGLVGAALVTELLVRSTSRANVAGTRTEVVAFVLTLPVWVGAAKLYGLYDRDDARANHSTADEVAAVFHMVTVCTFLVSAGAYVTGLVHPSLAKMATFWLAAIACVSAGRALARALAHRRFAYLQNTVIVGAGDVGQLIGRKLLAHPEYGLSLVGFVDDRPKERSDDLGEVALLGTPRHLDEIVEQLDVERVIVAFSNDSHEEVVSLIRSLRRLDVHVDVVPRLFESVGPRVGLHTIDGVPLVGLPPLRLSRSSLLMKRGLDCAVAVGVLVLGSPLLALIAIAVKATSPGPVFYMSERVGRNGRLLRVCKFRTMRRDADAMLDDLLRRDPEARNEFDRTHKLTDDPRLTPLGRMLRRTSLDELPQLWNVLRGELSLVGPRPITGYEYRRFWAADEAHEVPSAYWQFALRPGLTGYWQINGRSSMEYADRLRLDLSYLLNWSLRLDLEILAKTARALVARRGAA
jgi:exopolysaccharide biosynthesis polyprenyl glycosylphosphotransferase